MSSNQNVLHPQGCDSSGEAFPSGGDEARSPTGAGNALAEDLVAGGTPLDLLLQPMTRLQTPVHDNGHHVTTGESAAAGGVANNDPAKNAQSGYDYEELVYRALLAVSADTGDMPTYTNLNQPAGAMAYQYANPHDINTDARTIIQDTSQLMARDMTHLFSAGYGNAFGETSYAPAPTMVTRAPALGYPKSSFNKLVAGGERAQAPAVATRGPGGSMNMNQQSGAVTGRYNAQTHAATAGDVGQASASMPRLVDDFDFDLSAIDPDLFLIDTLPPANNLAPQVTHQAPPATAPAAAAGIKRKAASQDVGGAQQAATKPKLDLGPVAQQVAATPTVQKGLPASAAPQGVAGPRQGNPSSSRTVDRNKKLVDMVDPPACHLCFHAYTSENGVRIHYKEKHAAEMSQDKSNVLFKHPRTLSWFQAQGLDVTYKGTEAKQINARRRMADGMRSSDQEYVKDVYKESTSGRQRKNKERFAHLADA